MKLTFILMAVGISGAFLPAGTLWTQAQAEAPVSIVERGPHHRIVQRVFNETRADGKVVPRISRVVELETGMHYWADNEWKDSREEIEIVNGVAIARQGPHQVIFESNLKASGAIDFLTPDGRFRSTIIGLAYVDAASGQSVMFADVTDCEGAVLPPNQVWYLDAFEGDCVADVRMTYTKSGFEQDIIFRTAPPSPAEWGLSPETSHIVVFTEFIEAPVPAIQSIVLKQESDPVRRQQMAEPDLIDESLDFGVMKIGPGQAFPLDDSDAFSGSSVPTAKNWQQIEGRLFLLERVEYSTVLPHLKRLPQTAAVNARRKVVDPAQGKPVFARLLPAASNGLRQPWRDRQFAKVDPARPGFVLDYQTINGSLTNFSFNGDTTYVIRGNVSLYQTTVIEGGAVVKFTNSVAPRIEFYGPVDCRTSMYRPAVFTAKDDNTIGEIAPGSTGVPSGTYAYYTLHGKGSGVTYNLHDLRVRYATYAFALTSSNLNLSHVQAGNVTQVLAWQANSQITCRNFLFFDASTAFWGNGLSTNRAEHGTFHRVGTFISNTNYSSGVFLTNCLLISVTNNLKYSSGANVVTNLNDTGVFQTVGAASHYLATNSPHRNAATTNINSDLAKDLKKRTTYPPIVLSGFITTDTTLSPQAQRDTDTPDLGYHYDPLDIALSLAVLTNATLNLQPGTAVATVSPSYGTYGLALQAGSKVFSTGTPDNLNRIVRYNTVQEQATTNWSGFFGGSIITYYFGGQTPPAEAHFRFTDWSVPARDVEHFKVYYGFDMAGLDFTDCQFHGGWLVSQRATLSATNCLFERTGLIVDDDLGTFTMNPTFRHNLFFGGSQELVRGGGGTWIFRDNLFATTTNLSQTGTLTDDYNGYTATAIRLTPTNAHDVPLSVTNISFDTGWLGRFYLPTNLTSHNPLFNSGSTNANYLRLYHYTTTTNQFKETNSIVDLGFHYVAVNTNGVPIDTDGDELADYFEDKNGNGSKDSGETGWQSPTTDKDTDGDGVSDYVEYLLGRNALVAGTTNDFNGSLNLRIYTPLK